MTEHEIQTAEEWAARRDLRLAEPDMTKSPGGRPSVKDLLLGDPRERSKIDLYLE
jgi:hypothetical protein